MAFTASENERREITKSKWTNAKSSGHHFSSKVRKAFSTDAYCI